MRWVRNLAVSVGLAVVAWMPAAAQYSAKPGELVRINPELEANESALWVPVQPIALDFEIGRDQTLICPAPCQGVDQLVLWLFAQKIEGNQIITRQKQITVKIGEPSSPPPDPDWPDEPPPSGGISDKQLAEVRQLSATESARLADPQTASTLATAYRTAAGQITAAMPIEEAHRIVRTARENVMIARPFPRVDWTGYLKAMSAQFDRYEPAASQPNEYKKLILAMADGLVSTPAAWPSNL